jgi:dihydrofolate reductase
MRRMINSTYISADGVIEKPHEWPPSGSDGGVGGNVQSELLLSCDAVLMGRRTYEGFAPVWSAKSGDPLSDHMNAVAKYVVSTTLRDPEWTNTTVLDHDPIDEIERLKGQPGGNMVQYGFGPLTHALLDRGLLDEIRLWVHPLLVRGGGPQDLLYRDGALTKLKLSDLTRLDNGIVILVYQVL